MKIRMTITASRLFICVFNVISSFPIMNYIEIFFSTKLNSQSKVLSFLPLSLPSSHPSTYSPSFPPSHLLSFLPTLPPTLLPSFPPPSLCGLMFSFPYHHICSAVTMECVDIYFLPPLYICVPVKYSVSDVSKGIFGGLRLR